MTKIINVVSDDREKKLIARRQKYKDNKCKETPEQRNDRIRKQAEYRIKMKMLETTESHNENARKRKIARINRLAVEDPQQREKRLSKIKKTSNEDREKKRTEERERKRIKSDFRSPEERQILLSKNRAYYANKIANETDDQRNQRLSIRKQNADKRKATVDSFNDEINVFADSICEVCLKRCFPNQCVNLNTTSCGFPDYLPTELSSKSHLLLCHRCKNHLTSNKRIFPAKSYWNDLDPGIIPDELASCTQVELRLMSRVIPFIKIIKMDGLFGQYSFKGQAILFAQDVLEVAEKLPKMLPRSPEASGIVIILEELENLNIVRELQVNKERISRALDWLILNNPLYKDCKNITKQSDIQSVDFVREVNRDIILPVNQVFKAINDSSRIVRGSWHQGDYIFNQHNLNRQCAAMCVSSIIKCQFTTPSSWTRLDVDDVLLAGDALYDTIRNKSTEHGIVITADGYLLVSNFNVTKNDIGIFNAQVAINYDDDPAIFGNVDVQYNNYLPNLQNGLLRLFETHSYGILISASKSFGVMHLQNKFYFFDPHSCGAKGQASAQNGKSCIIECDNIEEFLRISKRNICGKNQPYTLDYIEVLIVNQQQNNNLLTQLELHIDTNDREHLHSMRTSVMLPIECHQPAEGEILENPDETSLNRIVRKTNDNIVNRFKEQKAEELAWYYLLTEGKNGLKEKRIVDISPLDYFQSRIMGKDLRFQRNDYLFYALSMYESLRVESNVSVCGKKIKFNNEMVEDVHLYIKNMRGSGSYWKNALNELLAQIKFLGPPHYFLTLSCNDLHWNDMIRALLNADGKPDEPPENVTILQRQKLVEKYPTIISRHFMIRVNAMIKFLRSNEKVFAGKLNDYWWRIEFQNRGSPHLHMVLWIEGTPEFNSPEGIERIDHVMTCDIPEDDDEIKNLIKKCQTHHHTHYCTQNTANKCQFYFPRKLSESTSIIDSSSNAFILNGGRICNLKRRLGAENVNNYNPTLLKLWKANIDIQPCGSNESIAFYIAKNISKNEPTNLDKSLNEAIKLIKNEQTDISRKMYKICMKILNERQVSACECVFRLCHLRMRESTRKVIFVNTRRPDSRYRVLNFKNGEQASGFCNNIIDRYEKRPTTHQHYNFEQMTLSQFAMIFEAYYPRKSTIDNDNDDDDGDGDADAYSEQTPERKSRLITLTDNSKMIIRTRPAVLRFPYFNISRDRDNYYYSLVLQHLPFRLESSVLSNHLSAEAAFLHNEPQMRQNNSNMDLYRQRDKELENAFNQLNAFQQLQDYVPPLNDQEEDEIPEINMNNDDFTSVKAKMNLGQRELFQYITSKIRCQLNGKDSQIKLFITGGAGTGKTFTLKLLVEQIKRCFVNMTHTVRVAALTGVAARLVNGQTLHSLLKLPVQKDGKSMPMLLLTGDFLKRMRHQWTDTKFLIIDEISMVSYEMLCMIEQRMKQLKNSDHLFGGINILFFGDLMQLPPVRGSSVFHQPVSMQPGTHLWQEFSFCELTQNMRQQGDNTFIDLLNNLRIGDLTRDQLNLLVSKVCTKNEGIFQIEKALRILPTVKQVDNFNESVLNFYEEMDVQITHIKSYDRLIDATKNKNNTDMAVIIPSDINKTGGLPKELSIFVGARVMLRYNVDTVKGLVNGAIGAIVEIVWPLYRHGQLSDRDIPAVNIDFGEIGKNIIGTFSKYTI